MNRYGIFWGIICLIVLAGCGVLPQPAAEDTPAPTIAAPPFQAGAVPLTTLIRNPSTFEGTFIQLTGQYEPLPLLVCNEDQHRSPATWALTFGDVRVLAGGFDLELRSLAAEGLLLTVEGRWQFWRGPVGCGRRAPVEELWYLEASRILSPNPLVRPTEEGQVVAELPSPTATVAEGTGPAPLPTTGNGGPTIPTPAPPAGATPTRPPTAATPTPTIGPFPTLPLPATPTPLFSPTPSATPTGGAGGPTPTESPSPTPDASASPNQTPAGTPVPVDQGEIEVHEVSDAPYNYPVKRNLAAGAAHRWTFSPISGQLTSASVSPVPELDVILQVLDSSDTVIATEDDRGAGLPEFIDELSLSGSGAYQLIVTAKGNSAGDYAVVVQTGEAEPFFVFQQNMNYGGNVSGNLPTVVDHLWHFQGTAGETVIITATSSDADLVLYVLGVEGGADSELEYANDTSTGEEVITLTLPETGYYSIGVGEAEFEIASYAMSLVEQ
ncbi:MAG: pre-peptidase C-terminal domain-containing protein [Chloroflexi bacterium]|nr:pre-peptidase C-terminal domain-containing protein [Chloroflexota bacterium]MCI0725857.1 pre-peptidase C-terminal domain-containing protein [Chloroflexota bacterium]